jgi:2-phospho-L-lactate guanylyltransferase
MRAMGPDSGTLQTTAILPVKGLKTAYQRLEPVLTHEQREQLAESLYLDVLAKLRRSRRIDQVLVVTSDLSVERRARWFGHQVLLQDEDSGHSEAAIAGARAAIEAGSDRVAMLPADCPMLEIEELDAYLGPSPQAALIVPDRHGTGTNALVLSPPDAFEPAFGPDSCARHVSRARAAGISFALQKIDSLAIDLDTPEDMAELRDRLLLDPGPAPRTATVLWKLGARQPTAVQQ